MSSWCPSATLCWPYTAMVATSPVSPSHSLPPHPHPHGHNLPTRPLCPRMMNESLRDMPGYEHTPVYFRKKLLNNIAPYRVCFCPLWPTPALSALSLLGLPPAIAFRSSLLLGLSRSSIVLQMCSEGQMSSAIYDF